MKTVRDVMTTEVVRLTPSNKVKTAIILMKGHKIGGLPVVEDQQVVGVLEYLDVLGKDYDIPIESIMHREFVTVPPEMPVTDAADLMCKMGTGRLLVVEKGKLVGIVTRSSLLPEVGKSLDPMTGLPRADAMRDWSVATLRSGQEISVIFLDLDQFASFNKNFGHIVGDKVLKHVAQVLLSNVDPERDMLCRYAGDEFVIVTTRKSEEAHELARNLVEKLNSSQDPDIPAPVTGSIGIYGGKRTKERERVHYEATLDNLINLASKACTEAKKQRSPIVQPNSAGSECPKPTESSVLRTPTDTVHAERGARLKICNLELSWGAGHTATVEVELAFGSVSHRSSCSGSAAGDNLLRLVAEATASAATQFLPSPEYSIMVASVHKLQEGAHFEHAVVTVQLITPQRQEWASGSAISKQGIYRAVAAATLDAVNRHIALLL